MITKLLTYLFPIWMAKRRKAMLPRPRRRYTTKRRDDWLQRRDKRWEPEKQVELDDGWVRHRNVKDK